MPEERPARSKRRERDVMGAMRVKRSWWEILVGCGGEDLGERYFEIVFGEVVVEIVDAKSGSC